LPAHRRRARALSGGRLAERGGRHDGGLVYDRRRRRVQRAAAVLSELARRLRCAGGAGTAGPRALSPGLRGGDLARDDGPAAAGEPLRAGEEGGRGVIPIAAVSVARMERSAIRGNVAANHRPRITLRSMRATRAMRMLRLPILLGV